MDNQKLKIKKTDLEADIDETKKRIIEKKDYLLRLDEPEQTAANKKWINKYNLS